MNDSRQTTGFAGLRAALLLIAALALSGCQTTWPVLPPPPAHANGQALWGIVNGQCLPDQTAHGQPAPCAVVSIGGGQEHGYVVLKDRDGASQYLVMPTHLITGIEDPALLAPDATNYFASAWEAQTWVDAKLAAPLNRQDVSVAVNSRYGRSQDLLHLHVDCLRTDVRNALSYDQTMMGPTWSWRIFTLAGHPYRAMLISGASLGSANPFQLLAQGMHVPPAEMGDWTLVLAGAQLADLRSGYGPGFILLAARADPAHGVYASGEELQDHACTGHAPAASAAPAPAHG